MVCEGLIVMTLSEMTLCNKVCDGLSISWITCMELRYGVIIGYNNGAMHY
jgi:hypothetical protein